MNYVNKNLHINAYILRTNVPLLDFILVHSIALLQYQIIAKKKPYNSSSIVNSTFNYSAHNFPRFTDKYALPRFPATRHQQEQRLVRKFLIESQLQPVLRKPLDHSDQLNHSIHLQILSG